MCVFESGGTKCLFFRLYKERLAQVELKLEEVRAGKAHEYLNPLTELQENMKIRTQVAGTEQAALLSK